MLIEPRLIPLCKRSFKKINFVPFGTTHSGNYSLTDKDALNKSNFDYQIAVASLPKFLGLRRVILVILLKDFLMLVNN